MYGSAKEKQYTPITKKPPYPGEDLAVLFVNLCNMCNYSINKH